MTKITKTDHKDNVVDYWIKSQGEKFIVVEHESGETFKLLREKFEYYLEDIGKIGQWFCEESGDSGEITYDDFYNDDPNEVDSHIDHYMKNDFCHTADFKVKTKSYKGADMWDRAPIPSSDTYNGYSVNNRPASKEEKELLNSI